MSDSSQGPGWWQASDGKWYPPEQAPGAAPGDTGVAPSSPGGFGGDSPFSQPSPGQPPAQQFSAGGTATGALPSVNGLSVASMVLGIVALVFSWCWFISVPCAVVGLPLGAIALSKISKGEADPKPKGMAIAGLVTCVIAVALVLIFVLVIYSSSTTTTNMFDFESLD